MNMHAWTNDDLLVALWSNMIATRCQAAYELGRRKDTARLRVILELDARRDKYAMPDLAEEYGAQERRQELIRQRYASPDLLLRTIFVYGDDNMRCLAFCATAGLGRDGLPLLQAIRESNQRVPYFAIALDVCPTSVLEMFIDKLYKELAFSSWRAGYITLLFRKKGAGIPTLALALASGDADRRKNVLEGLDECAGWARYDTLVHSVIDCLYDADELIAKAAIKLLRHARVAKAVPFLIPLLQHKALAYRVSGALRIIDTPEAREAVEAWQKQPSP